MEVGGVSGGGCGGCGCGGGGGGSGRKSNIQVGSKYWDGEAQLGPATKKLVIIWTRPIRQGQPDVYFSAIHWIYLQPMNKQH